MSSENNMKTRTGYTLIEIAAVLVIIGLLEGAVFQGQELIEYSRVKQALKQINDTTAAVFAYHERYGQLPGDDGPIAILTTRGDIWVAVAAGDADGNLEVTTAQTFTGASESGAFWQQLKAAGLISGDPANSGLRALPTNPWGGLLGVLASDMGGNLTGNKLCLSQVPGSAAKAIDAELDDGLGASDRLRATLGTSSTNTNPSNDVLAAPYSEDNVYTICYRM